jgi:hypothetical protein
MIIVMDKSELLDRLEDRLKAAQAEDAKAKKKHEADERAALVKFRENIRSAMSWDYTTAKRKGFRAGLDDGPNCPRPEASEIHTAIALVDPDKRKVQHINSDSIVGRAILWLPKSERQKKSLCD